MTVRPLLQQVISEESLPTDPVGLGKRIAVTPNPNTLNLNISVRDTDPGRAQRTANKLVKDFIVYVNTLTPTATPTTSASPSLTPSPTPSPSQQTTTTPQQESLVIAQPADLPTEPVSPRPLLNIALALLAGLAGGIWLAVLLEYMDSFAR